MRLEPYWRDKLGKDELVAEQLSARRERLQLKVLEERILIRGQAVAFLKGKLVNEIN